ncbi:hypothetical protein AVEN_257031-1, partial [Araneus ventricosus]
MQLLTYVLGCHVSSLKVAHYHEELHPTILGMQVNLKNLAATTVNLGTVTPRTSMRRPLRQ